MGSTNCCGNARKPFLWVSKIFILHNSFVVQSYSHHQRPRKGAYINKRKTCVRLLYAKNVWA